MFKYRKKSLKTLVDTGDKLRNEEIFLNLSRDLISVEPET